MYILELKMLQFKIDEVVMWTVLCLHLFLPLEKGDQMCYYLIRRENVGVTWWRLGLDVFSALVIVLL